MTSTVPAKSQLHGFSLTRLTYKKDKHSYNHHLRRSTTTKFPSRKSHPSVSPLQESMIHSPLRDSILIPPPPPPPPPPRQSFLHGSAQSPIHGNSEVKSSMRGESSKRFRITDSAKQSPNRGDVLKQSPVRGDSIKQFALRGDSVKQSPHRGDTVTQYSKSDLASESGPPVKSNGALIEYRRNDSRNLASQSTKNGTYSRNSDWVGENSKKKLRATEADVAGNKQKRSKILIKIPYMNKLEENPQEKAQKLHNDDQDAREDGKINNNDDEPKTWNLRPRKPTRKSLNLNGGAGKYNGSGMDDNKTQSPSRNFNNRSRESELHGGSTAEKEEKRKLSFSIALLKEDIEEDIFVMTGSKPARRPKKRAKTIQKQLDNLFPGIWLSSITPDSYKVYDNPPKG